jgi:hypothetical protein
MTKGLIAMKKLLSLVVLAAALGATVGCEDKKTSPPAGGGAGKSTPATGGSGSGSSSKT